MMGPQTRRNMSPNIRIAWYPTTSLMNPTDINMQAFSAILSVPAQPWFSSLLPNRDNFFKELITKFVGHFSHNKKLEIDEEDFYELYQGISVSLRKYLKMFNETKAIS